jgi:hypothetical protein
MMRRLAEELRSSSRRAEVLICHDGTPPPADWLDACGLPRVWRAVEVPDAGYYDLRNRGAQAALGDILVFLDSDVIPDAGWFEALLAPLTDPTVRVVAGHAYIDPDRLASKSIALAWFFPLRAAAAPPAPVTHFFANNVAFRRDTFLAHPFAPLADTSRGACVTLAEELGRAGITIWKTTAAQVSHPAPLGGRHFALRALAQGRDRVARERGWRATILGSVQRLVGHTGGATLRTLRDFSRVDLPALQVPAALAIGWSYYALYFAGEVGTFLGVGAVRRVRV